ncbi:MAG: GAF domain-containing protein [Sandaracinaceae bacterium]|nr:GAF domain-containing protein [Sandaracinaceae bacterium]
MDRPLERRTGERTDTVVDLARVATSARPLPIVLEQLCSRIADAAPAPVVSVYLLEREQDADALVMRANVGLREGSVGNVRLAIGEGVTGFAAACMQPVSTSTSAAESLYKAVSGIGEEAFPDYLAVPLPVAGRAIGVVVLQREPNVGFTDDDVVLVTSLAASVTLALVCANARHTQAEASSSTDGRTVRVRGTSIAPGSVLAQLEALPTLDSVIAGTQPASLPMTLDGIREDADQFIARIGPRLSPSAFANLTATRLLLDDARFREELLDRCERLGMLHGIRATIREYALAARRSPAARMQGDWVQNRAADVAGLCMVAVVRAAGTTIGRPGQALLIPEVPNLFLAMHAIHRRSAALLVAAELDPASTVAEVLRVCEMPTIASIESLSDWARPGDTLIVDATRGSVVVRPNADELASARAKRHEGPPGGG